LIGVPVKPAVANMGASVDTEPSIRPSKAAVLSVLQIDFLLIVPLSLLCNIYLRRLNLLIFNPSITMKKDKNITKQNIIN